MHSSLVSMFDLTGKTAIVTGASRGLGVSFARGLAKAGCNLIITARNIDNLRDVVTDLEQYGGRVVPVQADVCRAADVENMVARTVEQFGQLDLLVNNAGISAVADAERMTEDQWQSVIDTNLTGLFRCAQMAGRQMLEQGHGRIVNIASMYSISGASYVPQVSYVASKSAVLGLTRELAVEWAPRGLQVTAIVPGFYRSDQTIWAFEEDKELGAKLLAKVPMGRLGALEELEGTIVYMASSAADYMNGQAVILDGGFLSW
ncbi:MAG: SDR family oxidoreductase [bacterium]|nr:SDR family oxidoreductase [bacterium]